MNPHLSDDAVEFGEVATKAFSSAGGVDLARRAEADPSLRKSEVAPLLDRLGAFDLDATADPDSAEAAAALCRSAGQVVLPYPVVPALLAGAGAPLALRHGSSSLVDHANVFEQWRVTTIDGDVATATGAGDPLGTKLGPFVAPLQPRSGGRMERHDVSDAPQNGDGGVTSREIALHLTLTGFVIAGGLHAAIDLATAHVVDRVQFDKPLSAFQAVQFQLADAHVAAAGVDEMVQFALWRCTTVPDAAIADALGARLAALDAARAVLRTTQQLHGASGMCDEYDVSVIARHLQPALRIPFGSETTASLLADVIDRDGFVGLFDHAGVGS